MKIYSLSFIVLMLCFSFLSRAQNHKWTLKSCIDTALSASLNSDKSLIKEDYESLDLFKNNTLPSFEFYYLGQQKNHDYSAQDELDGFIKDNDLYFAQGINGLKNDFRPQEQVITLKVLDAYLKVLYDLEQIKIANENIDLFQELLTFAEALEKKGRYREAQLLISEIKSDADRFSAFDKICELSLDQITLMELMNIPLELDLEVEEIHPYSSESASLKRNFDFGQLRDAPELRNVLIDHEVALSKLYGLEKQYEQAEQAVQKMQNEFKSVSAEEVNFIKSNFFKIQAELLQAKYQFIFTKELLDFYKKGIISI